MYLAFTTSLIVLKKTLQIGASSARTIKTHYIVCTSFGFRGMQIERTANASTLPRARCLLMWWLFDERPLQLQNTSHTHANSHTHTTRMPTTQLISHALTAKWWPESTTIIRAQLFKWVALANEVPITLCVCVTLRGSRIIGLLQRGNI